MTTPTFSDQVPQNFLEMSLNPNTSPSSLNAPLTKRKEAPETQLDHSSTKKQAIVNPDKLPTKVEVNKVTSSNSVGSISTASIVGANIHTDDIWSFLEPQQDDFIDFLASIELPPISNDNNQYSSESEIINSFDDSVPSSEYFEVKQQMTALDIDDKLKMNTDYEVELISRFKRFY